jgi:alkane 1-monooxygenase
MSHSQLEITFDSLLWNWSKHLLALYLPLLSMVFLLTAPHSWYIALLVAIPPMILAHVLDTGNMQELRAPNPDFPDWPFNLIMFIAAGIQFFNIYLYLDYFSNNEFWRLDSLLAFILVGGSSGYSGITLAHEFIHRRSKLYQLVGRSLLVSVFYEHFYTEHLRGHHVKVATEGDPATAKFGENFNAFYLRTVPGQFRSAWAIECKRLQNENRSVLHPSIFRNRVAQGMAAQLLLSLVILLGFGPIALLMWLLQAQNASRLLEVVNYFEHWGLLRQSKHVQPWDSWDTHSWFTYYGLVGLTRHADHHANPTRAYQHLRVFSESPVLPAGYLGMVFMVFFQQGKFKRVMTDTLEKFQLGPYREVAVDNVS